MPTPALVDAGSAVCWSVIVGKPSGLDMTPEEHRQRGDAVDALFHEIVRRVVAKEP